jgi:hypothetical protein
LIDGHLACGIELSEAEDFAVAFAPGGSEVGGTVASKAEEAGIVNLVGFIDGCGELPGAAG